jgi:hypothetical protein
MVISRFAKYSNIVFLSLLLISLPSFGADDKEGQQIAEVKNITFSCNIPILNAPLQLERTASSINQIALLFAVADHGRLLHRQLKFKQNMQEIVIDHALLAGFRMTVGLGLMICHEFGHAVSVHYDSYSILKGMTFGWSPANILLGTFDEAFTKHRNVFKSDNQPIDIQGQIALGNELKDLYRNDMINSAMGPLAGIFSAYMAYKVAGHICPTLACEVITLYAFARNLDVAIPKFHILAFLCNQGIARIPHEQTQHDLRDLLVEVNVEIDRSNSDGEKFCKSWNKRKKIQDILNELYREEKEPNT